MNNQEYLIKRGWHQHGKSRYMWVDPHGKYDLCTAQLAVMIQSERDAAHLDTVLAALELAEPLLDEAVERLTILRDDFSTVGAKEPLAECERRLSQAREALAAVRAARDSK